METNDLSQIWDRLIDKLSHAISKANMDMYIRQITPVKLERMILQTISNDFIFDKTAC